ncbi:anti-sigma-I factor RsgI family protein [Fundicoccus culcitae]|uniref:Anti-sigma factor RsgI-like middle domain-containing protein n=1 Tax=Fundicoccus culcitae TaxID=2969821 RepID=A0ABY5P8U0_9LACT|nr:hypothetical protein [Fundicoccus culcitae]UUX34949.1 hypothetical protein NRE15_04695 [Fundicoccus culcitae]
MENKIKQAFDSIHAEQELKDKTVASVLDYMHRQGDKQTKKRWYRHRTLLTTVSLALVAGLIAFFVYRQPVSAVSIDSTTSIEVHFNRFNRVVEIINYDEHGDVSQSSLTSNAQTFEGLMEEILAAMDTEDIYITVAGQNENQNRHMMAYFENYQSDENQTMHLYQSSDEMMMQAMEMGMSMGRMNAMSQLETAGEDYTDGEFDDDSTADIMQAFEKHHRQMMDSNHMQDGQMQQMMEGSMHHNRR